MSGTQSDDELQVWDPEKGKYNRVMPRSGSLLLRPVGTGPRGIRREQC